MKNKKDCKKYAELIISMSTDFLMGKINESLYISNMSVALKSITKIKNENL